MTGPLVDPRTGIIPRLFPVEIPETFPAAFGMVTSVLSDTTRFSRWPSDSSGAGYAFGDVAAATAAAVGEAVERYCGNLVPPGLPRASHRELRRCGVDAVDPAFFALFCAGQHAQPGFPFVPMTGDLELEWAPGQDLATGAAVLVPASLVWVSHPAAAPGRGLPVTNPIIQAGLAAGPGTAAARLGALHEVIERDAMALGWHGRRPLRWVDPPPALAALARGRHGTLQTRFLAFPGAAGLVVAGALMRDPATGYLTLGTAARARPEPALRKALAEAVQLQLFVAGYDDPDGPYMRAARDPASPLKPWRADRRYGDSYRADLADVVDYGCHLQLYLDPAVQDRFEAELAAAATGTVPWTALATAAIDPGADAQLAELTGRLASAGHRVIAVDVTTEDVRPSGLRACRVLVPGLYSNSAAGLPFLGGGRLRALLDGDLDDRRRLPLPH